MLDLTVDVDGAVLANLELKGDQCGHERLKRVVKADTMRGRMRKITVVQ